LLLLLLRARDMAGTDSASRPVVGFVVCGFEPSGPLSTTCCYDTVKCEDYFKKYFRYAYSPRNERAPGLILVR
jgi:hypothetical protein